jgi:hypothetical protein
MQRSIARKQREEKTEEMVSVVLEGRMKVKVKVECE